MTNAIKKATRKVTTWLSRREAIRLNRVGGETPDPTPVEIPVSCERPLTLRDEMRRFINSELSIQAQEHGAETFEESNDFDVDDIEQDLTSQYTVSELVPEPEMPKDDLDGSPTQEDAQATSQEAEEPLSSASNGAEGTAQTAPPPAQ